MTTLQSMDGARIDGAWYTTITNFARHTHWLNAPMLAWSSYGTALFAVLLVIGWWSARRAAAAVMAASLASFLAVAVAYAANSGIKEVFREPRPCRALPQVFLVEACPKPDDYAFPSNHTTVAFAAAAALLLVNRLVGVIATAAAVLMAFSRVYVGAHYPHDVIAAAVLGIVVAVLLVLAGRRFGARPVERLRTGPLRPLLAGAADPEALKCRQGARGGSQWADSYASFAVFSAVSGSGKTFGRPTRLASATAATEE